jgi:hypothetical protein
MILKTQSNNDYAVHHVASDRGIIGIRPDYVIEVREDVLKEEDGPMLKYGLQALHTIELLLPSRSADRPSKNVIEPLYLNFDRINPGLPQIVMYKTLLDSFLLEGGSPVPRALI